MPSGFRYAMRMIAPLSVFLLPAKIHSTPFAKAAARAGGCLEASFNRKDFGPVQIGQAAEAVLDIRNHCNYGIIVGWTSVLNPEFSASTERQSFRVPPAGAFAVKLGFRPAKAGVRIGAAIFRRGGPGRDLKVPLKGRGEQPQGMAVAPIPLQRILDPAATHTAWIQVTNKGTQERIEAITSVTGKFQQPSGGMRVLLFHSSGSVGNEPFLTALKAMPGVSGVDEMDALKTAPTLDDLLDYPLVICSGHVPYPKAIGEAAGNALADYVDRGGRIIFMAGSLSEFEALEGRIRDMGYPPVERAALMAGTYHSATLASHPITEGVGAFTSFYVNAVSHVAYAPASLGTYTDGTLIGAWNQDKPTVFLNIATVGDYASGDAMKLVANTISWLGSWNAWFQPDREIYVINPSSTRAFPVTFNTYWMLPGFYQGILALDHNAPGTATPFELKVTVEVPSKRCLTPSPDSLDFGDVFAGGHYSKTIKLKNRCNAPTHVEGAGFAASAPFSLGTRFPAEVPAFGWLPVEIDYAPGAAQHDVGSLEIRSDADGHAAFDYAVKGNALAAPSLAADPDHFDVTVAAGSATEKTMTITNSGAADLAVTLGAVVDEPAKPLPAKLRILWYGTSNMDDVSNNVTDNLMFQPNVESIKIKGGFDFTPDLAYLFSYDMVVVSSEGDFADPKAVGDVLADYVDQGGRLVLTGFTLSTFKGAALEGRIASSAYLPVPFAPSGLNDPDYLEPPITVEDHPITEGVKRLRSVYALSYKAVQGDGKPLGHFLNGNLIGAYNTKKPIVAINWYAHDGDWQYDYTTLMGNAFEYLRSFDDWLRPDPWKVTVPAGGSREVTVHFDARGLPTGDRKGKLEGVNDKGIDPLEIPVNLKVTPGAMGG